MMGKEATTALRKLYDPEIGFFYHADSARDNDGFFARLREHLPDARRYLRSAGCSENPMCNNDDFLKFRAKIELAHDNIEVK